MRTVPLNPRDPYHPLDSLITWALLLALVSIEGGLPLWVVLAPLWLPVVTLAGALVLTIFQPPK